MLLWLALGILLGIPAGEGHLGLDVAIIPLPFYVSPSNCPCPGLQWLLESYPR